MKPKIKIPEHKAKCMIDNIFKNGLFELIFF